MIQEQISYQQIRATKETEYGTAFKDWIWILVKQYRDRTHFIFELLQNAEDAKATHVHLILTPDCLIIEHDGIPFSKEDVISITRVAKSTKSENGATIGKFGIGFKSVYAYTNTPRIYSGKYSFEIHDFIFPYEIAAFPVDSRITRIEVPFNNPEIAPQKAFQEIQSALNTQIGPDTVLFLNNIEKVSITITGYKDDIHISKAEAERPGTFGNVLDVSLIYTSRAQQLKQEYLVFTDCEEEAVKLAFQVSEKTLVPVSNTKIYTFFPTDKESHQAFLIHAPFDTTPARDNIVEDSDRNLIFIRNICDGLQMAFCWLRDNGYLSLAGLSAVFPLYEYPINTIFRSIYDCSLSMLREGESLIPTNAPGEFKSIGEIIMPESMAMVDCFPDEDIRYLLKMHRISWIAKDIIRDSYRTFKNYLQNNLTFRTYSWAEILPHLTRQYLSQKQKSWFVQLFNSIDSFATAKNNIGQKNTVDVSDIPFVRLRNGEQITPFECGIPAVYLNNPDTCPNKIDADFLSEPDIYHFYAVNLQIPDYNLERIVCDSILPKYYKRTSVNVSLAENIVDLKAIRDAMQTAPYIKHQLIDAYLVTDGNSWYKPSELHIPSGFDGRNIQEYQLVSEHIKLLYITLDYEQELKLNSKFFIELGCSAGLSPTTISKEQYLFYTEKYRGKSERDTLAKKILSKAYIHGISWDQSLEGFPEIFTEITFEKSIRIARFLNARANIIEIEGDLTGANDQNFSGANVETVHAYTALGLYLNFIPWIFTKDGAAVSPSEIHRRDLDGAYEKEARRLLDKLSFLMEDRVTEELLSRYKNDEDRETIKEILTNPDVLAEMTKALQKKKLAEKKQQEKKYRSPQDLLNQSTRKNSPVLNRVEPDEEEIPEAVPDPVRRRKKLEEAFTETLDYRDLVPRTQLRFTYRDQVTPEEKNFLLMQYNGVCQICQTTIQKIDGSLHFQAINMIRTSELSPDKKTALGLGWNSLCLCPNCAAKYQYGPKDMSRFTEQVQIQQVYPGEEKYFFLDIELQGEKVKIRYTPKHFLALKTALEVYAK